MCWSTTMAPRSFKAMPAAPASPVSGRTPIAMMSMSASTLPRVSSMCSRQPSSRMPLTPLPSSSRTPLLSMWWCTSAAMSGSMGAMT
ncbi:hypothetical protein DSECCO2_659640 [anaerobic digester metagenome]